MWLMMAVEQPILAAVIARSPDAKTNLAAFGLTFSLALLVESPVIMLLTAATALARDRRSYRLLLHFTAALATLLTCVHVLIAVTPVYALIVGRVVGAPVEVIGPGRTAFLLMLAWSPAIAYRRLWQGVMIRFGRPGAVSLTTAIRLVATASVALMALVFELPGAAIGGLSLSIGVTVAALAAYALARQSIRADLAADDGPGLEWRRLGEFYLPLALTSFIVLGGQPIISLGLGRSRDPLESLAVWPVITGLLFVFRSAGFAYQEVVVALLRDEHSLTQLRTFAMRLAAVLTGLLAVLALTPLASLWLSTIAGLSPELVALAGPGLILVVLIPALSVLIAWHRGVLVSAGHTAPVSWSVAVNLSVLVAVMAAGVSWHVLSGAHVAAIALSSALGAENVSLLLHARRAVQRLPVATALGDLEAAT
jgi:hypothetical protein